MLVGDKKLMTSSDGIFKYLPNILCYSHGMQEFVVSVCIN